MSRPIEIEIFCIAQTQINPPAVRRWLDHIGAGNFSNDMFERDELPATDPALLIAIAAKRCYMSFEPGLNPNVNKVRSDLVEYLDNILKSGHGSVLEHAVFTFALEGISRVFTGEMNRHRAGVGISEGSMRYIRYRDIPYWLPDSITDDAYDTENLRQKKTMSRAIFTRAFKQDEENYRELEQIWEDELKPEAKFAGKKHITSMMRRIIPMGVATGGVWTMNVRAVRHILALRASPAAEEEILRVFSQIGKHMVETQPMLFGDFSQTVEGYWVPKYAKV